MPTITDISQLDLNGSYSYADYLTWQFDGAVELLKGKISLMCPGPNVKHQRISWRLNGVLYNYFNQKPCAAFTAPFDVRLYDRSKSLLANKEVSTVVQPDICVICDSSKLDEQGCNGAPDWIIEILSKSTAKKDLQTKHALYAESGVKEYWLVFPYEEVINQFVLSDETGHYQLIKNYAGDDVAIPHLFPDLAIDLEELFKDV
ncbi:MAG: Uma2 family endonuclease [Methylococcales bacterium]|nr:Uma2 family endonuclease [Methylococcales bacterium]